MLSFMRYVIITFRLPGYRPCRVVLNLIFTLVHIRILLTAAALLHSTFCEGRTTISVGTARSDMRKGSMAASAMSSGRIIFSWGTPALHHNQEHGFERQRMEVIVFHMSGALYALD